VEAETKICCEKFMEEALFTKAFIGGGGLYPKQMQPTGQIQQDKEGNWHVNGCCGGGCYVLSNITHCPFCGKEL
jgi:hypothetical protein